MDHFSEDDAVRGGANTLLNQLMQDPPPGHPIRSVPREQLLQKRVEGPDDAGYINFGHGVIVSATQMLGKPQRRSLAWDDVCMISGLQKREDLNNRVVRVLDVIAKDGRVPCETMLGMERVRVRLDNLTRIEDANQLAKPPFSSMAEAERQDVAMFFYSNENSAKIPGVRGRVIKT